MSCSTRSTAARRALRPRWHSRSAQTRIIATLDELQRSELITREPDPADRRVRLLAITSVGRQVRAAAQAAIQANEDRLLARLSPDDRQAFLRAVTMLSALPQEEITGG
jgi:DNA-binding MarR family transcriptional regulator